MVQIRILFTLTRLSADGFARQYGIHVEIRIPLVWSARLPCGNRTAGLRAEELQRQFLKLITTKTKRMRTRSKRHRRMFLTLKQLLEPAARKGWQSISLKPKGALQQQEVIFQLFEEFALLNRVFAQATAQNEAANPFKARHPNMKSPVASKHPNLPSLYHYPKAANLPHRLHSKNLIFSLTTFQTSPTSPLAAF